MLVWKNVGTEFFLSKLIFMQLILHPSSGSLQTALRCAPVATKVPSRHPPDTFNTPARHPPDKFQTHSRHPPNPFDFSPASRQLQVASKTPSRHTPDTFQTPARYPPDTYKTSWRDSLDTLKTTSRILSHSFRCGFLILVWQRENKVKTYEDSSSCIVKVPYFRVIG